MIGRILSREPCPTPPDRETKADLRLWLTFLESYNGKSFFLDYIWLSFAKLHLYTDAAGSLGYGAVFGAHWFFGPWLHSWLGRNIIVLEMFPIVMSVSIWASDLANKCILFHTDNQGLVEVINRKTTKDRQLLVLYGSANDPRTANDPEPQMIPKLDRK